MSSRVLSFREFVDYLEREVDVEVQKLADDLVIGVDFELDSIVMLELVVAIEDLGAELPADLFLSGKTIRDIYREYLRVVGAQAAVGESADGVSAGQESGLEGAA